MSILFLTVLEPHFWFHLSPSLLKEANSVHNTDYKHECDNEYQGKVRVGPKQYFKWTGALPLGKLY